MRRSKSPNPWFNLTRGGSATTSRTPREVFGEVAANMRQTGSKRQASFSLQALLASLDLAFTPIVVLDGQSRASFCNAPFRKFATQELAQGRMPTWERRTEDPGCRPYASSSQCSAVVQAWLDSKSFSDRQDLHVFAQPLRIRGVVMTAFSIIDAERETAWSLRRDFVHDLVNATASLQVLIDLLEEVPPDQSHIEYVKLLQSSMKEVSSKIDHEKMLLDHSGPQFDLRDVKEIFAALVEHYQGLPTARKCRIEVREDSLGSLNGRVLETRVVRSLDRMLSAAMQGINEGELVALSCNRIGDEVDLRVHCQHEISLDLHRNIADQTLSVAWRGAALNRRSSAERISVLSNSGHSTTMSVRCRAFWEDTAFRAG